MNTKRLLTKVVECGCCGSFHRFAFRGDCRDDSERFADLEDAAKRLNRPVVETDEEGNMSSTFMKPNGTWGNVSSI